MSTAVICDPQFLLHTTGAHPECPERLTVIQKAFQAAGWLDASDPPPEAPSMHPPDILRPIRLEPRPATREELLRVHSAEHVARVEAACREGEPCLDPDTPICSESFRIASLAAGGGLTALEAILEGRVVNAFVACRPPGHHATRARAMGFCLFNSVAVVAAHARAVYGIQRILIVDWDVHHGNGTQDIFWSDPGVYYVSLHQDPHYPWTGGARERGEGGGEGRTLNVPLVSHTRPDVYRQAFSRALETVLETFTPDLILISAGFDGHAQDPLGSLELQDADFGWMTDQLCGLARTHASGRLLSLLEGGYSLGTLGQTVRMHVERLLVASHVLPLV